MKRTSWIIGILVVAAIFFFKHSHAPIVPYPDNAVPTAGGIRIPVTMTLPQGNQEFWSLNKSKQQYIVSLYNKQVLIDQFPAGAEVDKGLNGETYATSGSLQLGVEKYTASQIHVNSDGKTGYIVLQPAANTAGNGTGNAPSSANNTAGNSAANNS